MSNLQAALATLSDCEFIALSCCQTRDRAEMGYADEWQLLLRGKTADGKTVERELGYYAGTDDDDPAKFQEYAKLIDAYKAAYPNIPVKEENRHHREGIRQDQRFRFKTN